MPQQSKFRNFFMMREGEGEMRLLTQ